MDPRVLDNKELSRYEAYLGQDMAGYAEYRREEEAIVFTHTVTLPEHGGKGVGSSLARHSLDEARREGSRVRPVCSFYAGWISSHPEYQDVVAE